MHSHGHFVFLYHFFETVKPNLTIDTLDTDQLTIDPSSTLETLQSTLETPTETLDTPRSSSSSRKEDIHAIRDQAKVWCEALPDTIWKELSTEQKIRATRLHISDFSWSPGKPIDNPERYTATFCEEFERFLELATIDWMNETYVFDGKTYKALFFEKEDMKNFMVIRRERSGLCAVHASVTLQHYLDSLRNKTENHITFDVSHYIREKMSKEKQKQFLLTGKFGVTALDFFMTITGTTLEDFDPYSSAKANACGEAYFNKYKRGMLDSFSTYREPALVSNFATSKSLKDPNKVTYEGRENDFKYKDATKTTKRRHAMILIGMYVDDGGMLWFLIQNTWKDRYFLEISAEYFISCEAFVRFVPPVVDISLKGDPAVVDDTYAECSSPMSASDDALEEGSFFGDDDDDGNDDDDSDDDY